ncbi:PQQ-dependent sugar dehydrogenase [Microbacterium sp. zg.Y1090]|uniref:PQQ-dependent sugar dehydrogenase n=1 Tax=Microbacterium TaxID=33882 RepID=UPI00214C7AE3|nr:MULTISPECIES: PQQ-dependent sugar dehydrogenase [unclassified Microbacterium]MCR2814014.1 PQQ-dependent sugar dehydrogenase [Microbacterium sp. zg.Y1084]MCR2819288.1 PQQ-dependent sugar dehydrogenase [Microbacterium sp. zg.Y1090]WIM28270.1 PQQ-dependent sugar dehydrogenase [Microbacterium sp. zg-Y1090]
MTSTLRRAPRRLALAAAVAVAVAAPLAACAAAPPAAPTAVPAPAVTDAPGATATPRPSPGTAASGPPFDVVTGLTSPWSVVTMGRDAALIGERDTARVFEWTAGGGLRDVAVIEGVAHGGEGGLLGLALHDGELYAYATTPTGNRVQAYPIEGDAGSTTLGSPRTVIDGLPASGTHNAGRIAFGPDGMLYVPVGDAGDPDAAQDPDARNGKILRVTPDGDVPADNPRPGSPVYSLGHRNVQGLAWADDGRLFASEFGQNTWDELNVIEPGANYGWPTVEGAAGAAGFTDPVAQWPTAAASPSGIAIVDDTVLIANLRGEVLRAVPVDDPTAATEHLAGRYGRLRDVLTAPDGRVWIVTNNTDGRGDPRTGDDRIVSIDPADLTG